MAQLDMSAVKAPPRRRTTVQAKPIEPKKSAVDARTEGLLGLGQLAQGVCMLTKQYADAATIGMHYPPFAAEVAKLADTNDYLAKGIDFLIQVGPFAGIIATAAPLAMQLLANHKVIQPAGDVVPPEVLEAQMKAQIAKQQAEAMRQQQEAIREAEKAQREYERMMAQTGQMVAA